MELAEMNDWLDAIRDTVTSYRRMIDGSVAQLTDEELHARPVDGVNSVAILLRHLGGNLQSRWTDFLTSDGEKPDRNRDAEFQDWEGSRQSLLEYFDVGWTALTNACESIDGSIIERTINIRGEPHTIPQALTRSVTHLSYHVGQIALVARMVHKGEWNWLTIAPGASTEHNERTWGSSASRSVFAGEDKAT
jgi:uncharacterized damage-inducible protein DinB